MRCILNFWNLKLWTRAVDRTAFSPSAVSLICQALSSCKSAGPPGAASFDLERALNGFSCGSGSFLDSSLACGPGDVASSLAERHCFSEWSWSAGCFLWTLIDNDESEAFGSAVAAARIISLHRIYLARPSEMYPFVKSSSGSSVSCVCDETRSLRPLLASRASQLDADQCDRISSSGFVFDRSHEIACHVLICKDRPDDVLTQLVPAISSWRQSHRSGV